MNDSPHLSVKPESVTLMYLKDVEKYMLLREACDKLTDAFSKDEEIPVEFSVKLKQLSDRLDELEQLLKKYQKFFTDDDIDI